MSNWFSGDVDANGVRIHYYRTGGEKPPLVLSHGRRTVAGAGLALRAIWSPTTT